MTIFSKSTPKCKRIPNPVINGKLFPLIRHWRHVGNSKPYIIHQHFQVLNFLFSPSSSFKCASFYLSIYFHCSKTNKRRGLHLSPEDRKSTRLNSSHMSSSNADFCLNNE